MNHDKNIAEARHALDQIAQAKETLRRLDVIRSERMTGEIGEWLIEQIYGGARAASTSQKGYDLEIDGLRYQVKTHAKGDNNSARWTEFKYERGVFDFFIILVLSKEYAIKELYRIPEHVVFERINETLKQRVLKWDDFSDCLVPIGDIDNEAILKEFTKAG